MDESTCMVDVARYFLELHPERVLRQVHLLPHRHQADAGDPAPASPRARARRRTSPSWRSWPPRCKVSSLCGLGQTAPNPVLTTLRYFREEYDDHIRNKRCRGQEVQGADPLPRDRRDLHGLHALRQGLPHQGRPRGAEEGARRSTRTPASSAGCASRPAASTRSRSTTGEGLSMAADMIEITLDGRKLLVGAGPDHPRGGGEPGHPDPHALPRPPPGALRLLLGLPGAGGEGEGLRAQPAAPGSPRAWSITTGVARRARPPGAWPSSCCCPTTTGTARRPAPSPARRTSTSRATSAWSPTGSSRRRSS